MPSFFSKHAPCDRRVSFSRFISISLGDHGLKLPVFVDVLLGDIVVPYNLSGLADTDLWRQPSQVRIFKAFDVLL